MPTIFRREDHNVDLLLEDYFWLKVIINDGTSSTGDYILRLFDQQFVATDSAAGTSESAALTTSLISDVNASTLPVTAFAGAASNEMLIRVDNLGQSLVDVYNQTYSYDVSTTDDDGTIVAREHRPEILRVKNAANWDGTFVDLVDVPRVTGYTSEALRTPESRGRNRINANQLKHHVRFRYDPADFSIDDNHVHFFQIAPVVDGTELAAGPIEIVMTTSQYEDVDPALILAGTVPAAADFDSALKLRLPTRTSSLIVRNQDATNDLAFAFGSGDAEITLGTGESFRDNRLNVGELSLRGVGGTVDVEIYLSLNTQRSL